MCRSFPSGWRGADERVQNGTTASMIFPARFIVSYISQFMILEPGDVLTTGTPAGVGAGFNPERYNPKPGDKLRLGIDGLGEQHQSLRAYAAGALEQRAKQHVPARNRGHRHLA